jgi:hypothetical protein
MTLGDLERDLPGLTGWPARKVGEARSALNLLARVLGRSLSELPADPEPIRRLLDGAPWQVAGIGKRRWANVRSLIVAALHAAGVLSIRSRQRQCLLPEWQALLDRLAEPDLASKLSRFARWCSSKPLGPEGVTADLFERYAAELRDLSLVGHPREQMHVARRAWNKAAAQVAGWPQLHVPSPEDARRSLPWEAFPESLRQEVEAYRRERLGSALVHEERRPIRPITVRQHVDQLRRHAGRLVADGVPVHELGSLEVLLGLNYVKRSLALQLDNPQRTTPRASATANALCAVARHIRLPDEQLRELGGLVSRLSYRPSGMTEKNKARLARLRGSEEALRRLGRLPVEIADAVSKIQKPDYRHATRMRLAVAVEILLMAPMRVANLGCGSVPSAPTSSPSRPRCCTRPGWPRSRSASPSGPSTSGSPSSTRSPRPPASAWPGCTQWWRSTRPSSTGRSTSCSWTSPCTASR